MLYLALSFLVLLSPLTEAVPPNLPPEVAALVAAYERNPQQFLAAQANDNYYPNACPNYAQCSQDGKTSFDDLAAIIRDPAHQDKSDGQPTFMQDYSFVPGAGLQFLSQSIKKDLTDKGIDLSKLVMWSVASRSPQMGVGQTAYANIFDTNNGAIIGVWNQRDFDFSMTLPWSEIVYQTWHIAQATQTTVHQTHAPDWLPGGPISNLQYSVQFEVANPETLKVLANIYDNNNFLARVDQEWRKWTEADRNTENWFYSLLGTDTCKGTIDLLKYHTVEIGRKEITEIYTRWWGDKPDFWYVGNFLLVLFISILCKTACPSLPFLSHSAKSRELGISNDIRLNCSANASRCSMSSPSPNHGIYPDIPHPMRGIWLTACGL
ncbi:MAG: hypothetical protein L6R38_002499 [Xanthoria sp. 2 TBL-2021]|nr:MAG: hypothetical protein L6R38_002499 [Xanthoria sp. 2 TBL-2021]